MQLANSGSLRNVFCVAGLLLCSFSGRNMWSGSLFGSSFAFHDFIRGFVWKYGTRKFERLAFFSLLKWLFGGYIHHFYSIFWVILSSPFSLWQDGLVCAERALGTFRAQGSSWRGGDHFFYGPVWMTWSNFRNQNLTHVDHLPKIGSCFLPFSRERLSAGFFQ